MTLSLAAKITSDVLSLWQARLAELQTLIRLVRSLSQSPGGVTPERREQLESLLSLELRAIAQLPRPDFWSLVQTRIHVRDSGLQVICPDVGSAERELTTLRNNIGEQLVHVAQALTDGRDELSNQLEATSKAIEELHRLVGLFDAVLNRRVSDPVTPVGEVLNRAAEISGIALIITGDSHVGVVRGRGLVRLMAEVLMFVGNPARVDIVREGAWLAVSVQPTDSLPRRAGTDRLELLRFAAYFLQVPMDTDGQGFRFSLTVGE